MKIDVYEDNEENQVVLQTDGQIYMSVDEARNLAYELLNKADEIESNQEVEEE